MTIEENKPSRVFHLSKPLDLFKKLDWEIDNLKEVLTESEAQMGHSNHETAAYHAFNTAVTAWHLTDWVWSSLSDRNRSIQAKKFGFEVSNNNSKNLKSFQQAIRSKSRALEVCWEIANGSKHLENRKDSKISAQVNWKSKLATAGEFRAGHPLQTFSYEFIVSVDGTDLRILDVFEAAKEFWFQLLCEIGSIKDVYVKIGIQVTKTKQR